MTWWQIALAAIGALGALLAVIETAVAVDEQIRRRQEKGLGRWSS
jgi:mannose/fructose/N-acetylgalactosamine-specific phosphotransferase system component IIC